MLDLRVRSGCSPGSLERQKRRVKSLRARVMLATTSGQSREDVPPSRPEPPGSETSPRRWTWQARVPLLHAPVQRRMHPSVSSSRMRAVNMHPDTDTRPRRGDARGAGTFHSGATRRPQRQRLSPSLACRPYPQGSSRGHIAHCPRSNALLRCADEDENGRSRARLTD